MGIDVGAVSVTLAVFFERREEAALLVNVAENRRCELHSESLPSPLYKGALFYWDYTRHRGEPLKTVESIVGMIEEKIPEDAHSSIIFTGSGGKLCRSRFGVPYVNEFRASAEGVGLLYPDVRTIFEIGGEQSKYILIDRAEHDGIQILDYETNGECAAGTGSFFDQQVDRLKLRIETAGELVVRTDRAAPIAGRCSVFAKSDMIHAQQRGYQRPEVLKGLCEAVVRNFKGCITKGKRIESRVAFIGGVALNAGVVQAMKEQFKLTDRDLIVPKTGAWMGAIGAMLIGMRDAQANQGVISVRGSVREKPVYPTTPPLSMEKVVLLRDQESAIPPVPTDPFEVYLGIDVGSVSTNLALVNADGDLLHGIYRMTEGRPIDVVREAFSEMRLVAGSDARVTGVGTTGSGRELIGILVGADVIKDEITAHKTGAVHVSRQYLGNTGVDTIFEVGGQDSKYISIRDGVVVDFALNEACAAGTGSFLEEQARQLGIEIKDEFAELALSASHPLKLGERCTVFMEKELLPYLHQGILKADIAAGLAYSIVHNYLNRVVKRRPIGDVIYFQGGTAYNDAVAAAFSTVLEKEIIVPPHNGIMGAIGAALIAKQAMKSGRQSQFRGWNLDGVQWALREFTCSGCSNACVIQEFSVDGEKSYWGDKCSDRYRKRPKTDRKSKIADLGKFREQQFTDVSVRPPRRKEKRGVIGIPRVLYFYDRLPFWKTYFEMIGYEVLLSKPSMQDLIHAGVEATAAEPCFPIQTAHGHLLDLLEKDVDRIFLPNVVNEEDPVEGIASFVCPWAQTLPLVAIQTQALEGLREKLLYPNIQFRSGRAFVTDQTMSMARELGASRKENRIAVDAAYMTRNRFLRSIAEKGKSVLNAVGEKELDCVILLGRPYNLYDAGLNLNIPAKLRDLYGVNVIPMDFLPLNDVNIRSVHDHMYWNYGRMILQAASYANAHPRFHLIYLSNFKCGPDSYIRHYVEQAAGKPFLFIQLDSHANDAGVMTRIEAFLESKGML